MTNGEQFYDTDGEYHRYRKLLIVNKSTKLLGAVPTPQDINIDGEDLRFKNYVKFEVLKQELEILVDFKTMF